jgi:hypothetical protein
MLPGGWVAREVKLLEQPGFLLYERCKAEIFVTWGLRGRGLAMLGSN